MKNQEGPALQVVTPDNLRQLIEKYGAATPQQTFQVEMRNRLAPPHTRLHAVADEPTPSVTIPSPKRRATFRKKWSEWREKQPSSYIGQQLPQLGGRVVSRSATVSCIPEDPNAPKAQVISINSARKAL